MVRPPKYRIRPHLVTMATSDKLYALQEWCYESPAPHGYYVTHLDQVSLPAIAEWLRVQYDTSTVAERAFHISPASTAEKEIHPADHLLDFSLERNKLSVLFADEDEREFSAEVFVDSDQSTGTLSISSERVFLVLDIQDPYTNTQVYCSFINLWQYLVTKLG